MFDKSTKRSEYQTIPDEEPITYRYNVDQRIVLLGNNFVIKSSCLVDKLSKTRSDGICHTAATQTIVDEPWRFTLNYYTSSEELSDANQVIVLLVFDKNNLQSLDDLQPVMTKISDIKKSNASNSARRMDVILVAVDDELGRTLGTQKEDAIEGLSSHANLMCDQNDIDRFIKENETTIPILIVDDRTIDQGIDELRKCVIEKSKEQYLLSKLNALIQFAKGTAPTFSALNIVIATDETTEVMDEHIQAIAETLLAAIESKDSSTYLNGNAVKNALKTHLDVLQEEWTSRGCTAYNMLLTSLASVSSLIPGGKSLWESVLNRNYQQTGNPYLFSSLGIKQKMEKVIHEVKAGSEHNQSKSAKK